jgi:LysR family transcriptional regulator, hydrogen peroxide-inducible genes activator
MNISQLSLRDIEYIVTVGEELHFGKAAARLNVSQPTLSEQIKKLEAVLQVQLFERSRRSVQLTPEGVDLIQAGRNVLREAETFLKLAQNKKEPLSGEFHLGAIATVGPYYFPFVIAHLRKSFPELELIIHEGMTEDLLAMLDRGELNAVIASRTFEERNYRIYSLYHEPFWLVAPHDMDLKLKQGKVSARDLDKNRLILLTEGNCLKDEVLNFCSLSRGRASSRLQAASLETLIHLVASGNGYTFVPELAIREDKRLKHLVRYLPFSDKGASREIVLVSREQYPRPEEIRLLYQKLKEKKPI